MKNDEAHYVLKRYYSLPGIDRKMTENEIRFSNTMRILKNEMNIAMAEVIALKEILKIIDPSMCVIVKSLYSVSNSLAKQRDFLIAAMIQFKKRKPDEKERYALNKLVRDINSRLIYIRKTVIKENIDLTPIKEYLEIVKSDSFVEDFHGYFSNFKSSFEDGAIDEYAHHIVNTVKDAGRMEDYLPRLQQYKDSEEKRKQIILAEKAEEKRQKILYDHDTAEEFLFVFSNRVRYCIDHGVEDKRIGFCAVRASRKITESRGKAIVLKTKLLNGKPSYRYVGKNGVVTSFSSARVFDIHEAEQMVKTLLKADPSSAAIVLDV